MKKTHVITAVCHARTHTLVPMLWNPPVCLFNGTLSNVYVICCQIIGYGMTRSQPI